ncbi:MAG: hypothetical protein OEZ45_04505 [Candidatus Aminicenantes bacterium]|nr:hypothetical protein [Candidatus Aminicenantes bacterium]
MIFSPVISVPIISFSARHFVCLSYVMVRYYGLYSNVYRGKVRKAGAVILHTPIIKEEHHAPSKGWAEMIL